MEMQHPLLLASEPPPTSRRALPLLDVALDAQADITYHEAVVRSVINPPTATGLGFWSCNPYVGCAFGCAYCYARYAHRYVMERASAAGEKGGDGEELPPWLAFERRVLVKRDAPALVRQALTRHAARHARLLAGLEALVVGTATDPYQPAERRFRVTRGVLEALAEHEHLRVVIITKSPLIVRDLDVLARLATRSRLSVHVSLITLDRALARRIEPRAPTPESRLRAVRRLAEAGIDVGVNVMPVLPGITDDPHGLEALVREVAHAGARHLAAGALSRPRAIATCPGCTTPSPTSPPATAPRTRAARTRASAIATDCASASRRCASATASAPGCTTAHATRRTPIVPRQRAPRRPAARRDPVSRRPATWPARRRRSLHSTCEARQAGRALRFDGTAFILPV